MNHERKHHVHQQVAGNNLPKGTRPTPTLYQPTHLKLKPKPYHLSGGEKPFAIVLLRTKR